MTPEGEVIANSRLTTPAEPARSYAYCSDTRYIKTLHELVKGVSTLYHESTYSAADAERARIYWHSTSQDAAKWLVMPQSENCFLGHFSARYNNESQLLDEAKEIFPNSYLTCEGATFDI